VPAPVLAPRERLVLERVAEGQANAEVADALQISEHTVRNHLRNVLGKLHLFSRSQTSREVGATVRGDEPLDRS
jgi:DNA-binding CsgD family transcriptional regulator